LLLSDVIFFTGQPEGADARADYPGPRGDSRPPPAGPGPDFKFPAGGIGGLGMRVATWATTRLGRPAMVL
jgi:hypothetical protein